jgi:hypothetical protein
VTRLPFTLPDFTRIIWHNADARSVWTERLSKINSAWLRIEQQAVVDGRRDACLTFANPQQLPEYAGWAAARKLTVVPLALTGLSHQYSSSSQPLVSGQPFQYRVALTRPELALDWIQAWNDQGKGLNNQRIGELLGYPACCRAFFEKVWVTDGGVDTSWEQALGTEGAQPHQEGNRIVIAADTPPEANILLRWLGVRLVPHLPCSFNCQATVDAARMFAEVGRKMGYEQEVEWIYEMLSWPVEWTGLHGIAEIRTPVVTISTRTTATSGKHAVQKEGASYPAEGSLGLRFPYRVVTGKVTEKPSFKRSMLPVFELNGFGSEAGMDDAHAVVLSQLPEVPGTVLDLGAGNGRLLERMAEKGWQVSGIEHDQVRAGAGRIPLRRGNLLDVAIWPDHKDVIVFMPGRLVETSSEQAAAVRSALKERASQLLCYAYGDWLSKYDGLNSLMAAAGLGDWTVIHSSRGDGVEAALVTFTHSVEGSHGSSSKSEPAAV